MPDIIFTPEPEWTSGMPERDFWCIESWQLRVMNNSTRMHGCYFWAKSLNGTHIVDYWRKMLVSNVPIDMKAPLNTPEWATYVFWRGEPRHATTNHTTDF